MDDRPMLNTPIETETAEQEATRLAQFKQQVCARAEELTGLTFDSETGHCTTPGTVKMEGETKERWAAVCEQLGAAKDPKQVEQLWRQAGQILREAIQPETGIGF
jgi:hypothetical protein